MDIKKREILEGEGSQNMELGEIQELTDTAPEEFTENGSMEKSASEPAWG